MIARPLHITALLVAHGIACCGTAVNGQPLDLAQREQQAFRDAATRGGAPVVRIQPIGGVDQIDGRIVASGPTTGVIVSADGYIVSSSYGIVQSPSSILVTLADGTRTTAEKIATDHSRKIVLFKIETDQVLPTPQSVPRDEIQTGQWAIAMGRALAADTPTRSVGIISATQRMHGRAVQTDAKVSPVNYGGPLVDIVGRTFGILVPMSPAGDNEMAGDEWYDAGIGFAIPLADIERRLPQLKQGMDLHRGMLGVSLEAGSPHSSRPLVSKVHPGSPADTAGLAKGDLIRAIDGVRVETVTELRFQLVPRYAGDTVEIAFERDEQAAKTNATLVDTLPKFRQAFIGLLLERSAAADAQTDDANRDGASGQADTSDNRAPGIGVRYVYPDSPADQAGIQAGDHLVEIEGTAIRSRRDAMDAIAGLAAGQPVELSWQHRGDLQHGTLESQSGPAAPPGAAPPGAAFTTPFEGDRPETGSVEISLPEFPNSCRGYIPSTYRPDAPAPVLVWLHGPIEVDLENLVETFKPICEQFGIVFVAPRSENDRRWLATEAEYVAKLLSQVKSQYAIDADRIVVGGRGPGGTLAFRFANSLAANVRAIVAVQATPPRTMDPLAASPTKRLDILVALAESARSSPRVRQSAQSMRDAGVPVTTIELEAGQPRLEAEHLDILARWIDALDRI